MNKEEKLKRCNGCRDDFYNDKNPLGVKECWHLATARVVRKKEVHLDQCPPWTQEAQWFLNCFHRERHIYVDPKCTQGGPAMSDMARYDPTSHPGTESWMEEDRDGEFVRFADYQQALAERDAKIAELEAERDGLKAEIGMLEMGFKPAPAESIWGVTQSEQGMREAMLGHKENSDV